MTEWKHKIDIKQHLTDEVSLEGIALASNSIAKELKRLPLHLTDCYPLWDCIDFLECVSVLDCSIYDCEQDLLEEVNYQLRVIYDFCDAEKVWLGL